MVVFGLYSAIWIRIGARPDSGYHTSVIRAQTPNAAPVCANTTGNQSQGFQPLALLIDPAIHVQDG